MEILKQIFDKRTLKGTREKRANKPSVDVKAALKTARKRMKGILE